MKLGEICEISGGLTKNKKREIIRDKYPYLRVANVYSNELRLDDIKYIGATPDEAKKTMLQSGDLLFVEGNGSLEHIGRLAMWNNEMCECLHQNHLIKVRPNADISSKFVLYYFMSKDGRRSIERQASSTSGLYTLSISKIFNLEISLPCVNEQNHIVNQIEAKLSEIDKIHEITEKGLAQSESLRQSILKKAFEGKLVPQDSNDEPADILLARIKDKREIKESQNMSNWGKRK